VGLDLEMAFENIIMSLEVIEEMFMFIFKGSRNGIQRKWRPCGMDVVEWITIRRQFSFVQPFEYLRMARLFV